MHDIKFIRQNGQEFDRLLALRGEGAASEQILSLDAALRRCVTARQELQNQRKTLSQEIGQKKRRGEAADELVALVSQIKQKTAQSEEEEAKLRAELMAVLLHLPNLPAMDVPRGKSEKDNKEVSRHLSPKIQPSAREHYEIPALENLIDFEQAAALSGSRFVVLKGALARLERSLGQFMLDIQTRENGYREVSVPLLVHESSLVGTGQLPKFADDLFTLHSGHWLIPTAEVPLTNLVREQILDIDVLPLRFAALTPCFRKEAGAAGRDTHGMIRLHQFHKVEMVSIVEQGLGEKELERMLGCATGILDALEIPYRVVELCGGDLGFSARKTYDIEVWLSGQKTYREISSCSWCGDFQAHRMQARYRAKDGEIHMVETLNGSGLAVGRCLIALVEYYQTEQGQVAIPEVLRPYMNGLTEININQDQ